MTMLFRFATIFTFALLAACAYSPQQIAIEPDVETQGERYGTGRPVVVKVADAREQKVLGSRGGAYPETSVITVADGMTDAIARAAEATLAAQGFSVNSQAEPALIMTIFVDELVYDKPKSAILSEVVLKAALRMQLEGAGETYTGRYQTRSSRKLLFTPRQAKNERMINDIFSETLQRAFSDPKIKAFIANL